MLQAGDPPASSSPPSASSPRNRRYVLRLVLLLQAVSACCGCTANHALKAWQHSLSTYIGREGNGDPGVLRDLPQLQSAAELRPAVIRFNKLGIDGPGLPPFADRWDVHGVMLDSEPAQAMGHAFVVGIVRRTYLGACSLEDVRLVLLRMEGDHIRWHVGNRNAHALQRYLASLGESNSGDVARHATHQTFPALDDVFHLRFDQTAAVAQERRSGATWHVDLGRSKDPSPQ